MHWRGQKTAGGDHFPSALRPRGASDLNLLPLRHPLKQLAIDVSAILFGVMLACVAATAVGVSVYILFFMKVS